MCACGSLLDGGIVFLNKGRLVFGGFNSFYVSLSLLFSKAVVAFKASQLWGLFQINRLYSVKFAVLKIRASDFISSEGVPFYYFGYLPQWATCGNSTKIHHLLPMCRLANWVGTLTYPMCRLKFWVSSLEKILEILAVFSWELRSLFGKSWNMSRNFAQKVTICSQCVDWQIELAH